MPRLPFYRPQPEPEDDGFVGALLRENALDDDGDPVFTAKTLRAVRLDAKSRTVRYWSPVIVSAAVGGLAILALLQILLGAPTLQPTSLRGEEARLDIPVVRDLRDDALTPNPR